MDMDRRLIDAIGAGATLVVPDAVSARQLRYRYAQSRLHRGTGAPVWRSPQILSWHAWLSALQERLLWEGSLGFPGEFIDGWREMLIWEQVIGDAQGGADAGSDLEGLASLARDAWQQLHDFEGMDALAAWPAFGADHARFVHWMHAYQRLLDERRWVDQVRVRQALLEAVTQGSFAGERVVLVGFTALTPSQRRLIRACISRGLQLRVCRPRSMDGRQPDPRRIAYPDANAQAHAIGSWVRARLLADPTTAIAVVAPRMPVPEGRAGRELARALDDALLPAALLPDKPELPRPYLFAEETALAGQPATGAVLNALALCATHVDADRFSVLLHEPMLNDGHGEVAARALFDVWLREHGWSRIEVQALPSLLNQYGRRGRRPVQFESALNRARDAIGCADRAPTSEWAQRFRQLLDAFEWPGSRALSSVEAQIVDDIGAAIERFAGVSHLMPALTAGEALARFEGLLRRTPARLVRADAPVIVTALANAGALDVEHLWVFDADATQWPPPARPNPLLGAAFSQRLGIAFATADGQTRIARTLTGRPMRQVPSPVFSHAGRHGEQIREASPLVLALGLEARSGEPARGGPRLPVARASMGSVVDEFGPPLGADTGHGNAGGTPATAPPVVPLGDGPSQPTINRHEPLARGGATVLQTQAACPFRAFSEARLAATPLADPARRGALRRGVLLHDALSQLWSDIGCAQSLGELLRQGRVRARVEEAVASALRGFEGRGHAPVGGPAAQRLEQECLVDALMSWLQLESRRPLFRVIATEQVTSLTLGGLRLDLRVDRIDEIGEHGATLIIDYKSGHGGPGSGEWFGERPEAPQLPLYALSVQPPVAGVAYATLAVGGQRFRGLGNGDAALPDGVEEPPGDAGAPVPDRWLGQLAHWQRSLSALAGEFVAGRATVAPLHGPATCRRCHLAALCRIGDSGTATPSTPHDIDVAGEQR
jgi:ATP-dependent helicase/nuclease subunit B